MQTLNKIREEKRGAQTASAAPLFKVLTKNILWFLVSLIVLLPGLEVVFAAGHLGEECFLTIKPEIGFGHIANKLITWRSEGYSQSSFAEDGRRRLTITDAKLPQPGKRNKILLLGDSVPEAVQVPAQLSFASLLETRLNSLANLRRSGRYEVLNYGVSAYGTLQEYLQARELLKTEKPGTIVLFYHQGDSGDNVYMEGVNNFLPRPYCKLDNSGNLVLDWQFYDSFMNGQQAKEFHAQDYLREKSHIYGILNKVDLQLAQDPVYLTIKKTCGKILNELGRFTRKYGPAAASACFQPASKMQIGSAAETICTSQELQEINRAAGLSDAVYGTNELQRTFEWNDRQNSLNCAVISALERECRKYKCRLIVVGLPAPADNYAYTRELVCLQRLSEAAKGQFEFLDLNSRFAAMTEKERNASFFVYGDHFKAKGHEIVANALYRTMTAGAKEKK